MGTANQYTSTVIEPIIATIANGQTKSDIIDTYGVTIVQIELPAAFDGTSLTFETSSDGSTFQPYRNINNIIVSVTCSAGNNYGIAAQDFFPVRYVKIVSNATEAADRIIRLVPQSI